MLAQWPHFTSALVHPDLGPRELRSRQAGFFVDALQLNLTHFPLNVLREARRKRTYFNHVLARAEVNSSYVPARRLWQRAAHGLYELNPELRVKLLLAPGAEGEWVDPARLRDPLERGRVI